MDEMNRRVLIVDDMPEIHTDYRKVLAPSAKASAADSLAADILGSDETQAVEKPLFTVDCASQGEEGLQMVERALAEGRPYAAAFVDIRMPPGWDGVETIRQIWRVDPDIQVTIVTAYSDYSWETMQQELGATDQLLVLKKPFESIEVLQIASALTHKWHLSKQVKEQQQQLLHKSDALRKERDFSAGLLETAQTIMLLLNRDGTVEYINPYMEQLSGFTLQEVKGKDWFDTFLPPADHSKIREVFSRAIGDVQTRGNINPIIAKDGHEILIEWYDKSHRNMHGEITGLLSIGYDVTERIRTEQALKESEAKYTDLYDHSPDMYVSVDAETAAVRTCNQTLVDKLGYNKEEVLGHPIFDLYHPDCMEKVELAFQSFVTTGEVHNAELQLKKKNGDKVDVNLNVTAVRDENGKVLYSRSCWIDISERKRAEAELIKTKERFRQVVEQASDGIFIADIHGQYIDVNSAGCKMLGYERSELIGKTIVDLIPPEDADRLLESKDEMLEGDTHISEWRLKRKDGTFVTVEVSANILPNGQWQGFVRDISERRQAEAQLRKLSQAIEQSGEAVAITDRNGCIEYVNPAFSDITGYSQAEVMGENPRILKSGNQDGRFYEQMWSTLTAGHSWHGKVVNRAKSGEFYPAMLTISPIKNGDGEISHFVAIQQGLKEVEALEEQFHQAQKMEAIGTLVGGIAHNFNNNLAGMTGNLYLAKKAAAGLPEVIRRLEGVEKLAFSSAATIQQLLAFSRKGIVQMHPLSVTAFLKEAVKLQQVTLPENIALELQINDSDLTVKGDINQLQQVLMNLINNAADALDACKQPRIHIELQRYCADQGFVDRNEGVNPGEYASISVIDNGSGIGADQLEHIFEPFFTTKEPGKGTGLGLAMVYGAVKMHLGAIEVASEPQVGTTVSIYLPLLKENGSAETGNLVDDVITGSGETILLVDDNETVREVGRDVLEGLEYRVLTAEDGIEAVEIYRDHQDVIDLVILDVVMPKLGGVEALQAMRVINPDVKAMFATGYDKLSTLGSRDQDIDEKIITKPFAVSKLSQLIDEVLNS